MEIATNRRATEHESSKPIRGMKPKEAFSAACHPGHISRVRGWKRGRFDAEKYGVTCDRFRRLPRHLSRHHIIILRRCIQSETTIAEINTNRANSANCFHCFPPIRFNLGTPNFYSVQYVCFAYQGLLLNFRVPWAK